MKTILATFLFLSAAYIALIQIWKPEINAWEDQENANYARAEKLVYRGTPPSAVFAGSSLIAEMRYFLNDDELFILFQRGGSALEGVDLLVQSGVRPELLYVELNSLPVAHRADFARSLTSRPLRRLASWVYAFRIEYRPVNILINLARNIFDSGGTSPSDPWGELPSPAFDSKSEAYQVRLQMLRENYETPPKDNYERNLTKLADLLEQLASDGVRIVLVELPVHPGLLNTVYHQDRRRLLREQLADYHWIDWARDSQKVVFLDGIHFPLITSRELSQRLLRQ